jgi:hypothetical protein
MLNNPPPDICDHCGQTDVIWRRLDGPECQVRLEGGRVVTRSGAVYVCTRCGHTVAISSPGLRLSNFEVGTR